MQKRLARCLAGFLLSIAAVGCGPKHASFVSVDNVALGRVVIYRNGVAFYERRALVTGGSLFVTVPRDRVDDFLKSLTVTDARSRQPLPISIPRQQDDNGTNLVMRLQVPNVDTAEVVLTYVTEAPAWKPSYRVAFGKDAKVMLEAWAVVDNTSGEDWRDVMVGVGSSSALSFRYDLWSVRQIQREQLANEEKFAVAPPTGGSPYAVVPPAAKDGSEVISELGSDEIRGGPAGVGTDHELEKLAGEEVSVASISTTGSSRGRSEQDDGDEELAVISAPKRDASASRGRAHQAAKPAARASLDPRPPSDARVANGDLKVRKLAEQLQRSGKTIVIESYVRTAEASAQARERANAVRNQLIDRGIAPGRIVVAPKVDATRAEGVRFVAQAAAPAATASAGARAIDLSAAPVGESNFASTTPMTIERGASAMVSMVRADTDGEIVYLYDAESERGNARFAFRAVRFKNPTDSTLETGPVTVYGDKRFIGEGLTEAIPPRSSAVVPFALDRQIVVERKDSNEDKLARLVTVQRGVVTAEVQRERRQQLAVTNRMNQPAKIFLRHTVDKGWNLTDAPKAFERIGEAHLFELQLGPNETRTVTIAEATPIERTLDLSAAASLDMVNVWLDARGLPAGGSAAEGQRGVVETPGATPALKDQLRKLLAQHKTLVDLAQAQASMRRRLDDYRGRMDELHGQIVTLQAVKTGGDLMTHLKAKMRDISDRVQKTTIEIVDQEEKILLARVRFQDLLAELSLPDAVSVTREASNRAAHP